MTNLIDYIPEGEDQGGYEKGGYVDFIPAPTPVKHDVVEQVVEKPAPAPVKPVKK